MQAEPAAAILYFAAAIFASMVLVGSLLFVRTRVRRLRRRTIDELRVLFFAGEKVSVAAFDYVRAKYEMPTQAEHATTQQIEQKPTSELALLVSALPYMLICAVGSILLLVPYEQLVTGTWGIPMVYDNLFWALPVAPTDAQLREGAAVFAAAFLGGYLMTGRMLLRAVQNYELNQLTFLLAATQMVFGIVSGMMVYFVLRSVGLGSILVGNAGFGGFLLIAFIGGYVPTLGLVILAKQIHVRVFKSVNGQALENAKVVPLEALQGIDNEIGDRLRQTGLSDVQNMAAANPILLYVETPFGLYCAFDWVLQAQLCTSVGADTFHALKQFNIRTSLDLERAVLADDAPDDFVLALGPVLFPGAGGATPPALDAAAIRHGVMVMLDDLHIHRVRMLWRHIFNQITGPTQSQWLYRNDRTGPATPPPAPAPTGSAAAAVAEPVVVALITENAQEGPEALEDSAQV